MFAMCRRIDAEYAIVPMPVFEALREYDRHPAVKSHAARKASQRLRRTLNEYPMGAVHPWNPDPTTREEMILRMVGSSLNWSVDEAPSGYCYVRWKGEDVVTIPPDLDEEGIKQRIKEMWNDGRI